jgi:hypothetical protein
VVPGKLNTRRTTIETYCASNGVQIEQMVELDAMLATLDLVARSDWVTVLPGIMMALDTGAPPLKVNPLADPPLSLDLVMIEPSRRSMSESPAPSLPRWKRRIAAPQPALVRTGPGRREKEAGSRPLESFRFAGSAIVRQGTPLRPPPGWLASQQARDLGKGTRLAGIETLHLRHAPRAPRRAGLPSPRPLPSSPCPTARQGPPRLR